MGSSAASEVVLVLNIKGQAQVIKAMQASTDAVQAYADEVVSANDRIAASNDELAASLTETADLQRGSATETTDAVVSAQSEMADALAKTAEASTAATDEIIANNDRLVASADKTAVATDAMIGKEGAAATGAGGTGILGMLGSMKVLALGVGLYAGISSFSRYQSALTLLTTQAGLAANKLGAVRKEVNLLSAQTGVSKITLTQGFYNPISEGFSVKQSGIIERYAAELARMTGNPLQGQGGTSYALSTMMQTFGMKPTPHNTAQMAAFMNAGVGAGDMTLSQLLATNSTGFFNVTQAYGLSRQSAMGALDFFSSQSVSPQEAATRLRYFLSLLAAPSQQAQKYGITLGLTNNQVSGTEAEMAALGLRTTKMANLLRTPDGLAKAMQLVNSSVAGMSPVERIGVFSRLFGGGRSDATALSLAQHIGTLTMFTNRVDSMGKPSRLLQAWLTFEKTFAGQWGSFTAALSNTAVNIGSVVTPVIEGLLDVLRPLATFIGQNRVAAAGLAVVLGGALAIELGNLALKIGTQFVGAFSNLSMAGSRALYSIVGLNGAVTAEGVTATKTAAEIDAADAAMASGGAGGLLSKIGIAGGATGLALTAGAYALGKGFQSPGMSVAAPGHPGSRVPVLDQSASTPGQFLHVMGQFFSKVGLGAGRYLWTDSTHGDPFGLGHMASGLWHSLGLAAGGTFGTFNRPTAIVGEGGPHPEYVIPTDPVHRQRALGLYASLGTQLMASGGVVGSLANQGITGGVGGLSSLLASSMGLMGGLGGTNIPGVGQAVANAISTIVPPGGLRDLLLGLIGQVFSATASTLGSAGPGSTGGIVKGGATGSPQGFAVMLLRALGDSPTGADVASLVGWMAREGGNWHNTAFFNPLNTTLGMAGSHAMNSAGVQAYGSWAQGLAATVRTLQGGGYGDILSALASGKGLGSGDYAGLSRWSGGAYSSIPVGTYDSGGYLPEGISIAINGTGSPEPVGPVASGAGRSQTIQLVVDGKVLSEVVTGHIRSQMARR